MLSVARRYRLAIARDVNSVARATLSDLDVINQAEMEAVVAPIPDRHLRGSPASRMRDRT